MNSNLSGWLAALVFFAFTVSGLLAQARLLLLRERASMTGAITCSEISAGLQPTREFLSFFSFMLFALSALTRSYIDYFLLCTRVPAVLLSAFILVILARHSAGKACIFMRITWALLALFTCVFVLRIFNLSPLPLHLAGPVDIVLAGSSFVLFGSKLQQASQMYASGRSAAVSTWRETGIFLKDATGLIYALNIGNELFWVGLTHVLSGLSSTLILSIKVRNQRTGA
ncbi:MAG: hypothetical protein K1X79_10860 [Oligoflexia bacterium]|nr:hypothetical protein [Oligoflexia bacterium]